MAIRIRSKRPGFWRAGIQHPADRTYPAGAIPEELLDILKAERMLIVEEIADPVTIVNALHQGGAMVADIDLAGIRRQILLGGTSEIPEGRSGAAREAPSADSGSDASVSDGAQPAAPSLILEAQPAADAEGQQAEPEPGADARSSDAGAPASEGSTGSAAADSGAGPAPETGEVTGADPAAAPEAAPKRGRSKG